METLVGSETGGRDSAASDEVMQAANEQVVGLVQALQSIMQGRSRIASATGQQFGGKRDLFQQAGYIAVDGERFEDYWGLYQRNELAGRIVDIYPNTTWKDAPVFKVDDSEEHEFVQQVKNLNKRLGLWERFRRLDRLSRIGRYSVGLIGVREEGSGTDKALSRPLPERISSPDDVLYFSVYHERDAKINTWETDPRHPRFGYPKTYDVQLSSGVPGFASTREEVHHSRVIHAAEDLLDDEVFGRPALKRILNRLMDLDKVAAGTGEGYWQIIARILTGSVDPQMQAKEGDVEKLGERLEEMVHSLRRQFVGRGVDLNWLQADPPDPGNTADLFFMLIAAGADYPKRILFGTETGERASEQDERQFHGRVTERREQHAEPNLIRPFLRRLIERGALVDPGTYSISWPSLYEDTEQDKAASNLDVARTAKELAGIGGNPADFVIVDEAGRLKLQLPEGNEEDTPELDENFDEGPPEASE